MQNDMKTNRTLFCFLMTALVAMASVSCVRDAEPIFDKNATVRMQEALKNAQDVLTGAQYGWCMDDFMDEKNTTAIKGGYTILLKFEKDKVTAWGEMCEPSESFTSLYKMTTDDGPVLSFDDNNYILHYYSTPSGTSLNGYGQTDHYKALGGDFEFLVLEAKPEMVRLKGKRGGQVIRLFPLDKEPEAYMENLTANMIDLVVPHFEAVDRNLSIDIDRDNRHLILNYLAPASGDTPAVEKPVVEIPFLFTENGIRTSKGVKSAAEALSEADLPDVPAAFIEMLKGIDSDTFLWNGTDRTLTFAGIETKGKVPAGWLSYNEYLGDYVLTYNTTSTINVKLVEDVQFKSFRLTGVNPNYNLTVIYDMKNGSLGLRGQTIGKDGDYTFWFAPWTLATGGSFWYSTNYGMDTVLDQASYDADPAHFVLKWVEGPCVAGRPIDSFILYMRHSSGSGNKAMDVPGWLLPGNSYRMQYLNTLKKK